ncbi:hypothetical protein ACWD6R_31250 [Streptomyces sp. NPDC005151]
MHFRPERRFGLTLLCPCAATLTGGSGWSASGTAALAVVPCVVPSAATPLVAWDPSSGTTVADVCGHGRDATVIGPAAYDADGGLVLGGSTYLTTAPTMLGFLREATFAARVRVAAPSGYRLFDSQPSGKPGTDGVLVDPTPDNRVRFIGAGLNVVSRRRRAVRALPRPGGHDEPRWRRHRLRGRRAGGLRLGPG